VSKSVLIDTSFLITVYDDTRPNHVTAKEYHQYFLDNSITMLLSTIVVAEYHQGATIAPLLNSGLYKPLPFNVTDAFEVSNVAHSLGNGARRGNSRPEFRDDVKLIAQAQNYEVDYIITDDTSTLARYCNTLKEAEMLKSQVIPLNEPFNHHRFNDGGQVSMQV
jgi:predicted nucleic acid-binding protein